MCYQPVFETFGKKHKIKVYTVSELWKTYVSTAMIHFKGKLKQTFPFKIIESKVNE